jgi:hypothetical protein
MRITAIAKNLTPLKQFATMKFIPLAKLKKGLRHTFFQSILALGFVMKCQAVDVSGIINQDTTWANTSEPYTITSEVQVAYGSTLTIGPGVKVIGGSIRVYGMLDTAGTSVSKVRFENVVIDYSHNISSEPAQITIRHAILDGGKLLYPTGYEMNGSLTLEDSTLNKIPYIYIWYPTSDVHILRNTFISCEGIGAGSRGVNIYVENNFFESDCVYAVENWASYDDAQTYVRYNTFKITGRPVVKFKPGYVPSSMDARNNYWSTTDAGTINNLIFDQNDDFSCAGLIPFEPFLTEANPNTPSPVSQFINPIASISNKTYGDAPFVVDVPISTSGLSVVLSVKSGPATISGNTVTLTGVGEVVLAANQAGDANYNPATEITTSFTVSKVAQTIEIDPIPIKTFGDDSFAVTATASSGLPVVLTVESGPATISGNTVTITSSGTVVLAANQAGNANYNAATEVTTSFTVSKAAQTIAAITSIGNKIYGDGSFIITAPTATSGLPVTLSVKSGPATISGNTVTLTGAGTVELAANQLGNAEHAAATEVTTSFTVSKASQTIADFASLENKTLGDEPFAIAVPSATSGLPVVLAVKSGPATISGNTVTVNGTGIVVLAASQSGNANYLAADEAITAFAVMDIKSMAGDFIGNYDFDGAADLQDAYDYNGQLSLKVSPGGAFSGSLVIRGSRLGVKGKFDEEGNANLSIKTNTISQVNIELLIEPMSDKEYRVAATILWPDQPNTPFICHPVAYTGKGGETDFPLGGKQINSLLASQSTSGIDFGHGYTMIKTSKDGTLKFTGRAADGSAITGTTRLVKDASGDVADILAPVSFPLSAVKGLLHGVANINSNPGEGQYHFASPFKWTWLRLPQTKAKTYKEGFVEKLGVYGQVWSFTKGQSALPEAEGGFTFQVDPTSVLLEDPLELSGTWPTSNKPTWNVAPKGFTFKVNTATGQISGAAPRTINGKAAKALSYQGLLVRPALDSYDGAPLFGGGCLLGTESSGVVELTAP